MHNLQTQTDDEIEAKIEALLLEIRLPSHLKGYQFFKCAISAALSGNVPASKSIYDYLEAELGIAKSQMERNARTALGYISLTDLDHVLPRHPNRQSKRATPKEFIELCLLKLRADEQIQNRANENTEQDL